MKQSYEINLYNEIKEFYELYKDRPIKDNFGGMLSPHLFNTWYALKTLKPKLVIESGVWKGLGTWVIRKAVPDSKVISIDIDFSRLAYKDQNVTYLDKDIKIYDWNKIFLDNNVKNEEVLVFLDDHQDFLERLSYLDSLGIKHILYEDNYPSFQGDCLSPKKILSCSDYIIDKNGSKTLNKYSYYLYEEFYKYVKLYQELPPIFKLENTRWGDAWDELNYPTEKAILDNSYKEEFSLFFEEAKYYTWICYIELGKNK